MIRAVVDLGTHTVLLLIVRVKDGRVSVLREEERIVGLGRGLRKKGTITRAALGRTVAALREYRKICVRAGVRRVRFTATAVMRDARNSGAVKKRLEKAFGQKIRVLRPQEEARLVFLAAARTFPEVPAKTVIDIGGGSTEFIQGRGKRIRRLVSLPFGAIKLTERFITRFPVPVREMAALDRFLKAEFSTGLKDFGRGRGGTLIGVAGTFTTAAAMAQKLRTYQPSRITGHVITRRTAARWLAKLRRMDIPSQKRIPGLHPKRAGYVVAGMAIICRCFEYFRTNKITVCDAGLRWGVLYDWMGAGRVRTSTAPPFPAGDRTGSGTSSGNKRCRNSRCTGR